MIILLSSQMIFKIFHHLKFHYISFSDFLFFYIRELFSSLPIILNATLIISWILFKNKISIESQQHASLISGWDNKQDRSFAAEYLCHISLFNFLILFYINPLIHLNTLKPSSNQIEWLRTKSFDKKIDIPLSSQQLLSINKIDKGLIDNPVLIQATDRGWWYLSSQKATLTKQFLSFDDGELELYGQNHRSKIRFEHLSLPLEMPPSKVSLSGIDGKTLYHSDEPRALSELFWRLFLIVQPWLCLTPFRHQKILLRKTPHMSRDLLEATMFFGCSIVLAFNISKRLSVSPWYDLKLEIVLFLLLFLYAALKSWSRTYHA